MKRFVLVSLLALLTPLVLANPLLDQDFWPTATPETVQAAIRQGANVNARDQDGATPLHWAASHNTNPEVVRLLVERGADVNARTQIGMTPLHWAAFRNTNPEVVRLLVALGADVNARNQFGWTPLHRAAINNTNPEVIRLLVELGADITARDQDGGTPLHWASNNPNPEVVRLLVERGADVNARDQFGMTPLHWASNNPNPEVIRLLVELGADISARDQLGGTPLHRASNNPNPEVVRLLVALGADVNARNQNGWTPLHSAAFHSYTPEIVLTLLELGADHRARDAGGRTAWDLIQENEALHGSAAYWRLSDAQAQPGRDISVGPIGQHFQPGSPEWRFINHIFTELGVVRFDCPTGTVNSMCGRYESPARLFRQGFDLFADLRNPVSYTSLTSWILDNGVYLRFISVAGKEIGVSFSDGLVLATVLDYPVSPAQPEVVAPQPLAPPRVESLVLLSVTSEPPGAEVSLDGFVFATPTPIVNAPVTPGRDRLLRVALEGFETFEAPIDVTFDRNLSVALTPLATAEGAVGAPVADANSITLVVEATSWLEVYSGASRGGGATLLFRSVQPGETFTFPLPVFLHVGNAGGIVASLGGQEIGRLGASGEVLSRAFTAP